MKIMHISSAILALSCAVMSGTFGAESPTTAVSHGTKINVLEMKSVPAGNFLVNLLVDGKERLLNLKVNGNAAECVTSDDNRFKGLHGEFKLIGNGVFLVFFQNDNHRASQYWLFQSDGSAVVKEVPDRGEKQLAIPVADASIDLRNKGR